MIDKLKKIIDMRPFPARLLGIDLGDKTIGLAISDDRQSIATPLKTIKRRKFSLDIQELKDVCAEYDVQGFVFGWPVNMDGSEGPRCDVTRSFAHEMQTALLEEYGGKAENIWIALWDERLSTESVHNFLDETVEMRRSKHKAVIDKLAAQVILQGALDHIKQI